METAIKDIYEDFELLLHRDKQGEVYAQVVKSPAGSTRHEKFDVPYTKSEFNSFRRMIERIIRQSNNAKQFDLVQVQTFGSHLFDALPISVRSVYYSSQDQARQQKKGLRIKLRLEDSGLITIPWEALYDTGKQDFIALSQLTPVVRYPIVTKPKPKHPVENVLNILVVAPNPIENPVPELKLELERLKQAIEPLETRGRVKLHQLSKDKAVTFGYLRSYLRKEKIHVIHFIGHGKFDKDKSVGYLYFENEQRRSTLVSAVDFGRRVGDELSVYLVVLNACESAQTDETDVFAGVASELVESGIAAVVAMQFLITGKAAVAFASEFYQAFSDGANIEVAITDSRLAIKEAYDNKTVEWLSPVLFLNSDSGALFDIETRSEIPYIGVRSEPDSTSQGEDKEIAITLGHIARQIERDECLFVLGPELSTEAGLPGPEKIAKELIARLAIRYSNESLSEAAEMYEQRFSRVDLINALLDLNKNAKTDLDHAFGYRFLTEMPFLKLLISSNVDTTLEEVLRKSGKAPQIISRPRNMALLQDGSLSILKIHGDLQNVDIVITTDDYLNYHKSWSEFYNYLGDMAKRKTIVYLGFDPENRDFKWFEKNVRQECPQYTRKAYIVTSSKATTSNAEWIKKDLEVLVITTQKFFSQLRIMLQ